MIYSDAIFVCTHRQREMSIVVIVIYYSLGTEPVCIR